MSEFAAQEVGRIIESGPHPTEVDFYRLQITGAEKSKHVNVTPEELESIRRVLAGDLIVHDPDTLKAWLANAEARLVDDSDAYADEDIIRGLWVAVTGEPMAEPEDEEFGDLAVGAKVALKGQIERYPHFVIPAGWTGEVVELTQQLVRVKMDRHVRGAESWDNELAFTPEDNNREPWDARVAAVEWLLPLVSY